jgi:hypothetical protein
VEERTLAALFFGDLEKGGVESSRTVEDEQT